MATSKKSAEETEEKKDPQIKSTLIKVKKEKVDLREKEKPLVDIKVTNPVAYIKTWWKKLIGNEGLELKIKVKPLTAIAIAIIAATVTFGIGSFVLPFKIPFFQYKIDSIVENQNNFRETAFSGTLRYDANWDRYFLITNDDEAIKLDFPKTLALDTFEGRRILAAGKYYYDERRLLVESASDLEILPQVVEVIPTNTSTPTPSVIITPTPTININTSTDSGIVN